MKIPKKSIKVDNLFPIRLWKSRGKVYLANYGDDVYEVLNKDATPLSEEQYGGIVSEKMGFWTMAKRYKLTEVAEPVRSKASLP